MMPVHLILASALLSLGLASQSAQQSADQPASEPEAQAPAATPATATAEPAEYTTPRELLDALSVRDRAIDTLTGSVRLTTIQALQGDYQVRMGQLALRTVRASEQPERADPSDRRLYAVSFSQLQIGDRVQELDEEYIFDGRWLVERYPGERQFIKRELVPAGQTLDPMTLMRDAPFWVSVGDDADRLLADYDARLLDASFGLADDPELSGLLPFVEGTYQLELKPKPGSPGEDDWEAVRIWFTKDSLLPRLYVKAEWTGDQQIAELFRVRTDESLSDAIFDTSAPPPGSGWQVQIAPWRGRADG